MKQTLPPVLLWVLRILSVVLLYQVVHFFVSNSLQPGEDSHTVSKYLLELLRPIAEQMGYPDLTDTILRKIAHVLEFTVLGFFLTSAMALFSSHYARNIVWVLFLGLLLSCLDETIQSFVPDRTSQLLDVWLDFLGISIGFVVFSLLLGFLLLTVFLCKKLFALIQTNIARRTV